jgi:predicted Ser/Thr protein kinase
MTEPYVAPGDTIRDRWTIARELGRGGHSVVYLAHDRALETDVALKLLVPPPAAAKVARERMRREVQIVRGFSHENIVAVYDFVEEGPWSFIVMEYVAGPDLHVRVAEGGPLPADQAVRLGRDIAAALGTAHRRGILHRDVKPQNVLIDPDGRFRLTDFGSARLDGQIGVTATGGLAGTPDYTAPEILAGRRGDARADVYALGLTLYFALTRSRPGRVEPDDPASVGGGCRPAGVAPGIPAWLDEVVARATSSSADDRFPTAAALDQALAQAGTPLPDRSPRCLLCDGPDPFALGICPACGGAGHGEEALVFLRRGRESTPELELRLLDALPTVGARARIAVRGEQPLFRARGDGAARLVEQLGRHGLPAEAVPRNRILTALPAGFYVMLAAVVLAGAAAGLGAAPSLRWITPAFAGLLLLSARRSVTTPLVAGRPSADGLPAAVERELVATLASLPAGTSRSLLADIGRMGHALHGRLRRAGDGAAEVLAELLGASCVAASDVAQLDDSLGRFEQQQLRLAARPAGWLDALARCERARDALVQRLLEAMTVLGHLQGQAADLEAARSGLADSTAELRLEAKAREAAVAEIEALLVGPADAAASRTPRQPPPRTPRAGAGGRPPAPSAAG